MNNCKVDEYQRSIDVVNWLQQISSKNEFFKNVKVVPFHDLGIIFPKDMPNEKVIDLLKQYWEIYSK